MFFFFFRGYVWKCLLRNIDDKCKEYCKLRIGNRISSIYGTPSISPAGWSPSGLWLTSSVALPLIRPRDSRWKRCLVASPSSWPVCLAKAEASILICLTAPLCTPPTLIPAVQTWGGIFCDVFFGTMMILRGSLLTQGVTSRSRAWTPYEHWHDIYFA